MPWTDITRQDYARETEHTARCAIVAIDPGQYRGYVRVRELILRIEYSSLMEAKRGLV